MAPSSVPERGRIRPATPTDVTAAIAERRRRERRRYIFSMVIGGLVVAVLAVLVWLVAYSSVLSSRQVEVSGTALLTREQVEEAAVVPMGIPLAQFDPDPVARRVARLPQVGSVRVRTRYPNSVVIEVTERQAVVQRRVGNQWQQIDSNGVVFRSLDKRDRQLPVVDTATPDNALLADVATVVNGLTPSLRTGLDHIEAPGDDQITLKMRDGRKVVWGSVEQSAEKAQVAEALLLQKSFTVFNVSSPANPTAR